MLSRISPTPRNSNHAPFVDHSNAVPLSHPSRKCFGPRSLADLIRNSDYGFFNVRIILIKFQIQQKFIFKQPTSCQILFFFFVLSEFEYALRPCKTFLRHCMIFASIFSIRSYTQFKGSFFIRIARLLY